MTMPNDNQAPVVDTATAQAAQVDAAQTTTPPASGQDGAAQPAAGTEQQTAAANDNEQGKQQTGDESEATEQPRDEQGRYRSSKIQKRFDELTHARHAAEREAAYWRAQAEAMQKAKPAPQAHEFATDEEYEAARLDHRIEERARQTIADTAKQTAERYQQDAAQAADATYNERVQETISRIPDFVEVVTKAEIPITNEMQAALKSSAHGPDLVYQLAKNPAEAQRIASLPTAQMYMALGAMEARVSAPAPAAAAPVARTTSAPAPIKPGTPASAPANTDPNSMPMDQFEAFMKANGSRYIR
jgi:hypothetical protein